MKNNIIVTKRRYGFVRMLMLLTFFTIEYFAIIWKWQVTGGQEFVYAYVGYVLMLVLLLMKNTGSKVYLKYEMELSLVIKTVAVNTILFFFLAALVELTDKQCVFWDVMLLTLHNIITIVCVNVVMNVYCRHKHPAHSRRLYICRNTIEEMSGDYIAYYKSLDEIYGRIDKYDEIYLMDVESIRRNEILKYCFENGKIVYVTATLPDILMKASGLAQDVDVPVYYNTNFGIGKISSIIKRLMDVVFAIAGLLILWPFMVAAAVAIKLDDGGEVIYRQLRCTKDMKKFTIYKFRSMVKNDDLSIAKNEDDRITRVGRVIRKFKIDELPQLINVLKGDMSIVGPRPERPELIEQAIRDNPEFVLRTKVKAGITGYAQVHGYYNTTFKDKLAWDLLYIENYSLLLDIKIIIMTMFAIVNGNMKE